MICPAHIRFDLNADRDTNNFTFATNPYIDFAAHSYITYLNLNLSVISLFKSQ